MRLELLYNPLIELIAIASQRQRRLGKLKGTATAKAGSYRLIELLRTCCSSNHRLFMILDNGELQYRFFV